MRTTLKTLGLLSLITLGTLSMTGCTHERDEKVIYRDRDHYHGWREHRYGQAIFQPTMIENMATTDTLATAQ